MKTTYWRVDDNSVLFVGGADLYWHLPSRTQLQPAIRFVSAPPMGMTGYLSVHAIRRH